MAGITCITLNIIPAGGGWMNRKFMVQLLLWFSTPAAMAQSADTVYSPQARLRYARHLEAKGAYAWAAYEWYQLHLLAPDSQIPAKILRNYMLARMPDSVLAYDQLLGALPGLNRERHFAEAMLGRFTGNGGLSLMDSVLLAYTSACVAGDPAAAKMLELQYRKEMESWHDDAFNALMQLCQKTKSIPVGMYTVSSALLPGSGRIYLGRYTDGILSFAATGANVFMSTYTYSKLGARSLWPWFYGFLGAGFYSANIYGTLRDSRAEKNFRINKLKDEAGRFLFYRYSGMR